MYALLCGEKLKPKIASVEKKGQISGRVQIYLDTPNTIYIYKDTNEYPET